MYKFYEGDCKSLGRKGGFTAMDAKNDVRVTMRKQTKEEKEEQLKKQMEQEYQREQLRRVQRENAMRTREIYSERRKNGIIAIILTAVIFILVVLVQVLSAMGTLNVVAGTVITAVLAGLSFLIMRWLKVNKGRNKGNKEEKDRRQE